MKNNIDYYGMLLDFIPIRKRYKSYAGSEGIAYFVSPNFVLKEYTKSDDWESFDKIFECYCSEIQACSRAGMAVSEIYSWVKVPNMGHYTKGDKNAYQYFILEERVPGRELYFGYLEDAYSLASDICSASEFKKALTNEGSISLYREIVRRYISDYIQMNEWLESLSDEKLTAFLEDIYSMYKNGMFSYPDLFPHNILTDNNTSIKMIDMHMKDKDCSLKLETADSNFIRDMVGLFLYNSFSNQPEKYLISRNFNYADFENASSKNMSLSKQLILRIFALSGVICEKPVVNKKDMDIIDDSLSMMFDDESRKEIEKEIILE